VRHFSDILDYAGISRQELGDMEPCPEATYRVPDFCNRISKHFPVKKPAKEAFRILLLDLSQLFIEEQEHMLHHQIEEPLGLLYLMSYLNEKFKDRISGKVFKSRIDFDSYDELKRIIMDFNPDLIGIRTLSFYKEFFHRAVLMMRQWGVDVPIVTGGPYATSDYKLILQDPNVDLVVLGEGELTLGELVETMMENGNKLPGEEVLKEIQGIAFSIDKGKFKEPEKQRTSDILLLDELRSTRLEEYPGQNLYPINQPANLFYVIYTSGSTGKPKGVMLEHRNIANLVRYQYNHTNIDFDRVLQFTTISFDVSAQEIFSTLLAGGRLVLISKETLNDIPELFRVVEKENIKTLFAAASFLKFVMNEEEYVGLVPGCLKHIVTAGEQLIVNERFRKYLRENNVYLHNHYGPSETHVVTALTLDPEGEIPELPSIGRPITNTAIYILNRGLHLVPAGVAGELVISGQQVGRGYIYQPGLTSEKFKRAVISHSSLVIGSFYSSQETNDQSPMTNDRLYRTGDLARWLQDRNLEFLGRLDHQVKVRGFRVELGEIEGQLLNHHQIKECVVVAGEDERGGRYLCAYIVSRQELEVSELREYLGRDLPDYMIPSYFVFLENIPLTPNRKIDRGALPAPEMKAVDNYIAPETLWEEKLVEIWSEVLGIGRDVISVESNFFELGGHSLTATILAAKVNKEFQVRVPLVEIFQAPTIRGLSQYLQGAVEDGYSSIESVEKKEYYVLSSAQKRLYILHQMDVNSTVYNMLDIIPLAKAPDVEKLEETFKKLICCHEILRTSFEMVNGEPIQGIHEEVEFKIEGRGGSLCPPFDRDRDKGSRGELPLQYNEIIESFIRPFDLSEAPLLRVALFKTEEENHLLLVDMHHIICDGISHRVLVQDFNALVGGEELESLRIQYKDFAEWQCSEQETERLKQQEVYWLDRFRGEVPVLDLPLDFPRPAVQSFAGSRIYFEIGKEETGALKRMALEERATLFMVLLAVTNILLSKLSGQQDIVIGTPIAGRRNADMQKMIGMFVNTLALRNEPGDELCFSEFLRDLKGHTLAAFENQEYPFEELVEKVSLDRDVSRNPLFDVMMVLQNFAEFQEKSRVRKIIGKEAVELTTTKFDLTLEAVEAGSRLILIFNYCTALFKPQTIERFITYFKNIIKEITGNTKIKISDIEIIPPEEKDRILYDFNNTETEYPGGKTIHELFEEQVERTPDNVAVVASCQLAVGAAAFPANKGESSGETVQLAYKELNEKSNRLALVLIEKGVLADDIVVIMVERSIEMIIGILGILKAGGAYLPIDPDYPQERIDYMLKDSNAKVLLAAPAAQVKVEAEVKEDSIERIDISNLLSSSTLTLTSTLSKVSSANLAYIIYTSGTTGRPKGVGVEHRQAVNTLLYRGEVYGMNTGHISLQLFSFSFDGFVTSFFTPVIAGAKVVLPGKDEVKDIRLIKDIIARYGVTHFISIPGFYQAVLDSLGLEDLKSLKVVTLAGDKLPHHLLECSRETNKDIEIAHEYGVTEAAVMSTLYRHQERDNQVKIGGPIGNVGIVIVDRNGCMQPVELPGEICIFGAGVACGYLSNPELTAEKFRRAFICHSSFVIRSSESTNDQYLMTNDRLYLTGDLARWLADGNIEFLGRIDHQVKIRGFRIELEEIENRLSAHPGIKRAVVIDWKSPGGEKYLCAYIVSQMLLSADSLEAFLSQSLPDYMIPSYFVPLEEIPLTPNGKIDRKALPAPGLKQEECIAPRNPIEKKLVEIWSVVLEVEKEKIGIDDNFFHLGGHSLKAAFVMSRINRELGVRVPLVEVFQTPTIRELSEYITGTKEEISIIKDDQLVLLKKGWGRVEPFFFIHDGSGEVEGYIEFCNRLSGAYDFWGIRAQTIENYAPLNLSIEELARRYIETIRVVQAHGPYRIGGWSIGGTIGFEMVRQLEEENEEVCFLGLIDTVPPDKDFPEKGIEFNLENELKLIRDYFPGEAITKKLKGIGDFSRVWPEVAAYLESGGFWLEHDTDSMFKNVVPGDFARTVPNLEQMSIKEFIIYLNMVRTFDNARNNYIPGRKIDTAVHFFKATDGEVIDAEKWNIYCDKPVKVYDIPGDHFSLLKMPEVVKFAKLFAKMINK
ncbi:MAG: amino acid adenylation domain-containing protein, partial [Candidatus Aminicenantes bacterium]|nr:amino acid adenylation domain-containing protein [Candidatus Aminicenantes bacterium]NIM79368.1 amino acid adenylation domain-containing protein [Candidatus Aminicenantes bacterium]NIN18645.1 amino acid adenylation domain-containing protein [Candidatus Aminicenantes bacterium]NIN42534.1 amino acid adenylation domain-containing protein [Candidatus Aminicenantes bacterium]NIN85300.1 amino acid adenylation domain-containing protein [Candidatus Aminicenantes bacterium]